MGKEAQQQAMEKGQKGRLRVMIADLQKDHSSRGSLTAVSRTKIGSAIVDLVPFLGGIKQLNEAMDGEVYATGEKLQGKKRIVHGLVGVGSFALDFTGIGEGAKALKVGGKSVGLVKAAAKKLGTGGASKSAALLEKSAVFMAKNPELVRTAENVVQYHLDDGIRYVKTASRGEARQIVKDKLSEYVHPEVAGLIVDAGEAKLRGSFLPAQNTQAAPHAANVLSARKAALVASRVQSFTQKTPAAPAPPRTFQSSQSQMMSAQSQTAVSVAGSVSTTISPKPSKQQIMNKAQGGRVASLITSTTKKTLTYGLSAGTWGVLKTGGRSKIIAAGMDLVPLLGGIKQLNEAIDGETITGQKLSGKKRIVHGLVGVGSFALDLIGIGEGAKALKVGGKSVGLVKAAAKKLGTGGASKSAALLEKSAVFMAKNPELVRTAENVVQYHLDDGIRYVKTASRGEARQIVKDKLSEYVPPEVAGMIVDAGEAKMRGGEFSARKAALTAGRHMIKVGTAKPFSMPLSQPMKRPAPTGAEDQKMEEEEEEIQEQERTSLLRRAIVRQKLEMQDEEQDEEKKTLAQKGKRAAVRYVFKQAMRRGFIYLINFIAASLDFAFAGISFIITCFVYLFTLGYLNLEMIYGTHIAKGKSKIISPTSWFPIPMPVDPNALILQSFIVTMDIALGVAVVIMGAGGMCIVHDYVKLVSDPLYFGFAIATDGGDLCLGGIMKSVLGL